MQGGPTRTTGRARWSAVLVLVSASAIALAVVEGIVRLVVVPSPVAWGTFRGRPLPPLRVIPGRRPADDAVASDGITWSDLQGPLREDGLLGYAPREDAVSTNGWWTTNDLGARATTDTAPWPSAERRRVLVFGESYATGSRVRQADAWPAVLESTHPALEVVNLAVDGYGMGQALLRFRRVAATTDYDVALLVLVPTADLWRDVNTIRALAHPDWDSFIVMPRFVLADGRLALVASPYAVPSDVYGDAPNGMSARLRAHLRAYDRFYLPSLYESPPWIGRLATYKLAALFYGRRTRHRMLASLGGSGFDSDAEAVRVTAAIVATMRAEAVAAGRDFALVVMPEAYTLTLLARPDYAAGWQRVTAAMCGAPTRCLDLAPTMCAIPKDELDAGFDGTHYGPRTNRAIAAAVGEWLATLDLTRATRGASPTRAAP